MSRDLTILLDRLKTYTELPVEEIRTLDPGHYTSPELYALEIEHIWRKEWILVGHACELKKPGDFMAFDLINEPMMVVRGEDMKLRAVSTVCRHRFMPVVRHGERGNTSRFQCPYHRWTYGLDGRLNRALYMEENKSFDMQKVRLPEFRLELWNDLIWVNLDDDAEPLAPRLADIEEWLSFYRGDWVSPCPYDKVWPANWKLCVENNEGYHSMGVHTDTVELTTPTRNGQHGRHGDYWTSTAWNYALETQVTQNILEKLDWKPGRRQQEVPALEVAVVYPANGLTWGPEGLGWYTHWPISINETRAWMSSASPPELANPAAAPDPDSYNRVLDQDLTAFSGGIGWGVLSDKLDAGPLSWQEENVLRSHQWTARKILEAVG